MEGAELLPLKETENEQSSPESEPEPLMECRLNHRLWTSLLQKHPTPRTGAEKENATSGVFSRPEGLSQMAACKRGFTMRRK